MRILRPTLCLLIFLLPSLPCCQLILSANSCLYTWKCFKSSRLHFWKFQIETDQRQRSLHLHPWKSYLSASGIGPILQCPKFWLDSLRWHRSCILPWRSQHPTMTSSEGQTFYSHIASKLMSCQYWYPLSTSCWSAVFLEQYHPTAMKPLP